MMPDRHKCPIAGILGWGLPIGCPFSGFAIFAYSLYICGLHRLHLLLPIASNCKACCSIRRSRT